MVEWHHRLDEYEFEQALGVAHTGKPGVLQSEGLLFLHGLESNPGSSLQTEEEAGLP